MTVTPLLSNCQIVVHKTSMYIVKKLAHSQHTPSAPDWLWSEHRRILPTVFAEIEALLGRTFTLDACSF